MVLASIPSCDAVINLNLNIKYLNRLGTNESEVIKQPNVMFCYIEKCFEIFKKNQMYNVLN